MIDEFDPEKIKNHLKWTVSYSLICLVLMPILAGSFWWVFAILGLIVGGWQSLLYGATLIAVHISGRALFVFQVFVTVVFPATLAAHLSTYAQRVDVSHLANFLTDGYGALVLAILFYVGKTGSSIVDAKYWFRGFVFVSTALFVICLMGQLDIKIGDLDGDHDYDLEFSRLRQATGKYTIQYIIYTVITYGGLLYGMRKLKRA